MTKRLIKAYRNHIGFQIIPLVILLIFFLCQYYFLSQHTQALHLNDELEHISGGWMMVEHNQDLYLDISVNHQPIPFLVGAMLVKFFQPPNLFMLIERSRQMMFLISIAGALVLTYRFRWAGLMASILVELAKFSLFGYYLLGESLALYPLMLSGGLIFVLLFYRKHWSRLDDVLLGTALCVSIFAWLPSVVFGLIALTIYIRYRPAESRLRSLISIVAVIGLLSFVVHWPAWYEETIVNLWQYFLPLETGATTGLKRLMLMFFPLSSIFHLEVFAAKYYFLMLVMGLLSAVMIKRPTGNYPAVYWPVMYLLLLSLNLRNHSFDNMGYGSFHLLPQMGLLTLLSLLTAFLAYRNSNRTRGQIIVQAGLIVIVLLNVADWWTERRDKTLDHYVQYDSVEAVGKAFKAIAHEGDTLLSGPQYGEVNLVSQLPFPGRQITYFDWSFEVPRLRNEFLELLDQNPPTFIYFPEPDSPFFLAMKDIIVTSYVPIIHVEDKYRGLFIHETAFKQRSEEEWNRLETLNFRRSAN